MVSTLLIALFVYIEVPHSLFHVLGACLLMVAFRFESFRIPGNRKDNAKTLMYILVCIEACVGVWVLMHAICGILIMAGPAKKCILLNAYTPGYLLLGVLAIRNSCELVNRRVVLNESTFTVDETDYTSLLGSTDLHDLILFARNQGKAITCGGHYLWEHTVQQCRKTDRERGAVAKMLVLHCRTSQGNTLCRLSKNL
mgnify:CR=1 FL=1